MTKMISSEWVSKFFPKRKKLFIFQTLMLLILSLPLQSVLNRSLMVREVKSKFHFYLLLKFFMWIEPVLL